MVGLDFRTPTPDAAINQFCYKRKLLLRFPAKVETLVILRAAHM
jgi:hypothetical protein